VNVGSALGEGVVVVVLAVLWIIQWLVIVAAVISWVNPDPRNPIVQFLYRSTEPILRPFRRLLPPGRTGGIDFSPLLVILVILFIRTVLYRLYPRPGGFF
jgi:YggT family protein